MHLGFFGFITFSFIVSSLAYGRVMKTTADKRVRIVVAFLMNASILTLAAALLYKFDVQTFHKQTEGVFSGLGIGLLILFIPIITLFNIYIMEYLKNKNRRTTN